MYKNEWNNRTVQFVSVVFGSFPTGTDVVSSDFMGIVNMKNIVFVSLFVFLCSFSIFSQEAYAAESDYDDSFAFADEYAESEDEDESDSDYYFEDFDENRFFEEEKPVKKEVGRIAYPHRYFEMGTAIDFNLSNNYFNVTDLLKKDLVIDLEKIADEMPDKGWLLNVNLYPNFFMNLNLKNGVHVGLNTGVDVYGSMNVSKDLFDFIGYGNKMGETLSFSSDMRGDAFVYAGIAVGFNLFGFHLEVMPSLFKPLIHAETSEMSATVENPEGGGLKARLVSELALYSCIDIDNTDNLQESILDAIKEGWGFDIESSLEHKIFNTLNGAVYSRIPIVPGRLNYAAKMNMEYSMEMDNLLDFSDESLTTETKDPEMTYGSADYKLHRPFRMGAQVAWRPFGKWFTLGGLVGFGVKEPFTSNWHGYFEYKLSCDIDLFIKNWDFLGLHTYTSYMNEVFHHSVGLLLNLRVIEFNVGVSVTGGSFVSSFKGAGVGAYFMTSFGF